MSGRAAFILYLSTLLLVVWLAGLYHFSTNQSGNGSGGDAVAHSVPIWLSALWPTVRPVILYLLSRIHCSNCSLDPTLGTCNVWLLLLGKHWDGLDDIP